ncbi:MAG: translation initiation factor IF-2 [Hyphomicrobiaceae bacterium]
MSEPKETPDNPLRQGQRKPLSLKRTVESGHVQQKFSHGRSKSVVVEKKRKRALNPGEVEETTPAPAAPAAEAPRPQAPRPTSAESARVEVQRTPASARNLSEGERNARAQALQAAQIRQAEEHRQRSERAPLQSESQPEPVAEASASQGETASSDTSAAAAPAVVMADVAAPVAEAPALPPSAEVESQPAPAAEVPNVPAPPQQAAPASGFRPRPERPEPRGDRPTEFRRGPGGPGGPGGPRPDRDFGGERRGPGGGPGGPRPDRGPYQARPGGPGGPGGPRPGGPSAGPRPAAGPDSAFKSFGMKGPQIVRHERAAPRPGAPAADPLARVRPDVEAPKQRQLRPVQTTAEAEEEERNKKKGPGGKVVRSPVKAVEDRRERGKLTINNAFNDEQRERSLASLKRKREREKLKAMGIPQTREKIVREVIIPEVITIQELANRMTERAVDVIKYLMKQGEMHQINDVIDTDTAELIVQEFGHTPKRVSEADVEEGFIGEKDESEELETRAPVVTIMGHVDHGKTSLLDALRLANVASGEAGGITQHIGAYQVATDQGQRITFIDTPGHEAFTAMRARGAKVTDIVVLVVAADDGVMPQTVEAINHAKAAGVPLIVAINKIDKPDADPSRVRTELLQHGIVVESMSGETLEVEVSAIKRTNLDKLLEAIALQAELLDLKANPNRSAEGFVIEAKLEKGRGPVGTLLVQRGTLHVGDIVVAGMSWGRVRALIDDRNENVREAGPSVPVETLGFDGAPEAGDQFAVVESEARAREITDYRVRKRRETLGPSAGTGRTLEQMMQQLKETGKKEFILVVKGDVQGSVEAIGGALKKISTDEVEARIVHSAVGGITESDVALANASKAIIVGFNVRANVQAKAAAERDGVEIRYYNIIYDLVDDVKAAMSGLLAPTIRELFLGNAQILQVFNISKFGKVAGCRITDGKVERGAKVRLIRDNVVIHEGTLSILKRFKDDVKEVQTGQECGMSFANYQDIREGDVIECFNVETVIRTL